MKTIHITIITLICAHYSPLISQELWTKDISNLIEHDKAEEVYTGSDGSAAVELYDYYLWFDKSGTLIRKIPFDNPTTNSTQDNTFISIYTNVLHLNSSTIITCLQGYQYDWLQYSFFKIYNKNPDLDGEWIQVDTEFESNAKNSKYLGYVKEGVLHILDLASIDGNASNNSTNTDQAENTNIEYSKIDGWIYFTEFPWVYSNNNQSWYYFSTPNPGIFAYNENLPGNKWMILNGIE
jgi:hypothetical protein